MGMNLAIGAGWPAISEPTPAARDAPPARIAYFRDDCPNIRQECEILRNRSRIFSKKRRAPKSYPLLVILHHTKSQHGAKRQAIHPQCLAMIQGWRVRLSGPVWSGCHDGTAIPPLQEKRRCGRWPQRLFGELDRGVCRDRHRIDFHSTLHRHPPKPSGIQVSRGPGLQSAGTTSAHNPPGGTECRWLSRSPLPQPMSSLQGRRCPGCCR